MGELTVKQHMKAIAASGGTKTYKRHGRAFMSKIAKDGWAKRKKKKIIDKK